MGAVYQRILVGFQDTDQGRDALAFGRALGRACGAETIVATAPEKDRDIGALARERHADLVVLGSTHRGPVGRVVPGATVERLLGEPPCAVAVAPPGFGRPADGGWHPLDGGDEDAGMRVVGIGYDGTAAAGEALGLATELALRNGAALRVYTVARNYPHAPGASGDDRGPGVPTEAELLRERLHDAVADLPAEVRALPVFLRGFAADELIEAVHAGVDLLVLGSRGGGPVRRAFHRSVSSAVMHRARCPVLISPTGVKAPAAALV